MARKNLLAKNLLAMQKYYPKEFQFFPKTWLLPESLDEIMKVVVWSLGCLMDGAYPRHDRKGNPWPQGSTREFLGG